MLSLHIIVDNCPDERLDRALTYLTCTKQIAVCIGGGSQMDRTMQYIERVRAALPNIVIMMRILEDTGIIMKLASQQWYEHYITSRMGWLQKNRVVLVVDNETSGDDALIKDYVQRSITAAQMLHSAGLNGAFCRFATGNIGESQYQFLKPLLDVLNAGDWISPNEYTNAPGKSSGGHLERWKRIQAITTKKLNVSIGECGILNDYHANAGYRGIPLSGSAMAAQLLADEIWYNGGSIPRFLFVIGGYSNWDSLQVGDDALEYLETYYAKNPIGQLPPPVIQPPPPPQPTPTSITVSLSVLQAIRDSMQSQLNVVDQLIKSAK